MTGAAAPWPGRITIAAPICTVAIPVSYDLLQGLDPARAGVGRHLRRHGFPVGRLATALLLPGGSPPVNTAAGSHVASGSTHP